MIRYTHHQRLGISGQGSELLSTASCSLNPKATGGSGS